MRSRKGISPVIATVIIVAVAIAISIAVAGWLFGLWGALGTAQPQVKITGVSAVYDATAETLTVTLAYTNDGNAADQIQSAVAVLPDGSSVTANTIQVDGANSTTIPANHQGTITLVFDVTGKTLTTGDKVTIEVVLAETGKHSTVLTVTTP